jgi:hypothetical protein
MHGHVTMHGHLTMHGHFTMHGHTNVKKSVSMVVSTIYYVIEQFKAT